MSMQTMATVKGGSVGVQEYEGQAQSIPVNQTSPFRDGDKKCAAQRKEHSRNNPGL